MAATMVRSLSRCGALNDIHLLVPYRDKNSSKLLVIALDYPTFKHVRVNELSVYMRISVGREFTD